MAKEGIQKPKFTFVLCTENKEINIHTSQSQSKNRKSSFLRRLTNKHRIFFVIIKYFVHL